MKFGKVNTQDIIDTALKIPGLMHGYDLEVLVEARKKSCGICVEIGCLVGLSTVAIALSSDEKLISIDNFDYKNITNDSKKFFGDKKNTTDFYKKWEANIVKYSDMSKHIVIKADSSSKKAVEKVSNYDVGMLFIDGNHKYEYVKQDIKNYVPLVNRGGCVVFHDYSPEWGTYKAVNEAIEEGMIKKVGDEFYSNLKKRTANSKYYTLLTEKL